MNRTDIPRAGRESDDLLAIDDDVADEPRRERAPWKILIVDDEAEVHEATTFALDGLEVGGRGIDFMHAHSSAEARAILAAHPDIAVVLLDVVMEAEDAGLTLVKDIREAQGNAIVRIILRTGQPGYAPELEVMRRYDINDYKSKAELTRTTLTTAITAAIRSCEQLRTIELRQRQALAIADMSANFFAVEGQGIEGPVAACLARLTELWNLEDCVLCWLEDGRCTVLAGASDRLPDPDGSMIARLANAEVLRPDAATRLFPISLDARLCGCLSVRRASGGDPWHEDDLTLLRVAADAVGGAIHRAQQRREMLDINASLEDRVRDRTRELELANRELEAYSYTVSHDLRAPLRSVAGFLAMIRENLGPGLDEDNRRYMDLVATSIDHMNNLIADLLRFAHLGRAAIRPEPIDTRVMVEELKREIEAVADGVATEWRFGALPVIEADRALFRQALSNLLSNAHKYTRGTPHPVIEVGTEPGSERETVLFVRDNGTGFDMAYADRLFRPFSRLHSSREFDGTGIGLATVKSIIQRHGGRVWAESAPERGATFRVAMPAGASQPA